MASTLVQFINAAVRRRYFTPYSQGSVASFATQFNTDWASVLPGGAAIGIVAKAGAATVAEIIVAPGQVLEVNPTDFVGYNFGIWEVVPAVKMGRTVSDGATNSNTTVTSATAAFVSGDVGAIIAGPGIPGSATILQINNGTSVGISVAATATATAQPLTISPVTASYIPDVI